VSPGPAGRPVVLASNGSGVTELCYRATVLLSQSKSAVVLESNIFGVIEWSYRVTVLVLQSENWCCQTDR
jgi:hypothetical protein